MSYYVIDVESDGPILGVNSLVLFGWIMNCKQLFMGKHVQLVNLITKKHLPSVVFQEKNMSLLKIRKLFSSNFRYGSLKQILTGNLF